MTPDSVSKRSKRKTPPLLAVVSLLLLLVALGSFAFGLWQTGFGFLVFHWLFGAIAMMRRKKPVTKAPSSPEGPLIR